MTREAKLKKIIENKFGNLKEFSRQVDLPYTTIRSILERGVANAKVENVITICKALGISTEQLISDNGLQISYKSFVYPFVPHSISAGFPMLTDGVTTFDKIELPDLVLGKYAGDPLLLIMKINGESMNKIIPNDSLIAVKGVHLENLKDGDIVVYSHMHEYSVKQFYRRGNDVIFKPMSKDPTFTDYVVRADDDELAIHGRVVVYIVEK